MVVSQKVNKDFRSFLIEEKKIGKNLSRKECPNQQHPTPHPFNYFYRLWQLYQIISTIYNRNGFRTHTVWQIL